jgi:hypothetical protein
VPFVVRIKGCPVIEDQAQVIGHPPAAVVAFPTVINGYVPFVTNRVLVLAACHACNDAISDWKKMELMLTVYHACQLMMADADGLEIHHGVPTVFVPMGMIYG